MKTITEEDNLHNDWYEQAEDIDASNIGAFVSNLTEYYEHDYGTICHAAAASAVAGAHAVDNSNQGGITGFQAGAIMWQFIQKWMNYEGPMTLIQWDNMLFPQYASLFDKTISAQTWERLQDLAKKNLEKGEEYVSPRVRAHWQSIVDGIPPFGYRVIDANPA